MPTKSGKSAFSYVLEFEKTVILFNDYLLNQRNLHFSMY